MGGGLCKSQLMNDDRDGSKAWIITARSLFLAAAPVQVDLYIIVATTVIASRPHIYVATCM